MNGIIVIDKPMDFTSHDVVAVVKGIFKEKHLGHTGTLDPNATGVLPICFGYATRLIEYMDSSPKRYSAKGKLGIVTDTQDIWGNVLQNNVFEPITKESLEAVIPKFIGEITQIPSKYSAIRVNGRHLYSYAHGGEEVEIPSRRVMVYSIKLIDFDYKNQEFSLDIECGRGTYVRTICHDIGNMLGPGACLTELKRTSACGFDIEDAICLDELRKMPQNDVFSLIRPVEDSVGFMNRVHIDQNQKVDFCNGKHLKVQQNNMSFDDPVCVFFDNELWGIGKWDNPNRLKPVKVFIR